MSITRVSRVTGIPSVTPMIADMPSSSCGQDMQRDIRRAHDVVHDRGAIGGPTDRLGAEQGHVHRALASGRLRRSGQARSAAARAGLTTEVAAPRCDRRAESEEDRLIVERAKPMAGDKRDEQVDRVRAKIDRGADDSRGPGGQEPLGRAAIRTGGCRGWRCRVEGTSALSGLAWAARRGGLRSARRLCASSVAARGRGPAGDADLAARGRSSRGGFPEEAGVLADAGGRLHRHFAGVGHCLGRRGFDRAVNWRFAAGAWAAAELLPRATGAFSGETAPAA